MKKWISKHKKLSLALLILLVVLIAVGATCGIMYIIRHTGEVTSYDYEVAEGQTAESSAAEEEDSIKIPGYTSVTIPAGETDIAFTMTNPEENQVYFRITLTLTDTDDVIYQSDLIQPGDSLYNITLNHAIEPGTYDLTIQYDTFTMDGNYTPRNGATMNCSLTAE